MSRSKELEDLAIDIKSFLISAPGGRTCEEISADYRATNKKPIPFRKLGFDSEREVLDDLVRIKDLYFSGGRYRVQMQGAPGAEHLVALVRTQKTNKVSQFKGGPPPPSRPPVRGNNSARGRGRGARGGGAPASRFNNRLLRGSSVYPQISNMYGGPQPLFPNNFGTRPVVHPTRGVTARPRSPVNRGSYHPPATLSIPQRPVPNQPRAQPAAVETKQGDTASTRAPGLQSQAERQIRAKPQQARNHVDPKTIDVTTKSPRGGGRKLRGKVTPSSRGPPSASSPSSIEPCTSTQIHPPPGFGKKEELVPTDPTTKPNVQATETIMKPAETQQQLLDKLFKQASEAALEALLGVERNERIHPKTSLSISDISLKLGIQKYQNELISNMIRQAAKPHSLFRMIDEESTGNLIRLKPVTHLFPDLEISILKNGPARLDRILSLWRLETDEARESVILELSQTKTFIMSRAEGGDSVVEVSLRNKSNDTGLIPPQEIVVNEDVGDEESMRQLWIKIFPLELSHPHSFTFATADGMEKMRELTALMSEFYHNHSEINELTLTAASHFRYCAVREGNGDWRRAEVIKRSDPNETIRSAVIPSSNSAVWLRFIDTGSVERVSITSCKGLLGYFMETPAVALAGEMELEPLGVIWEEEAITAFRNFFTTHDPTQGLVANLWAYPARLVRNERTGPPTVVIADCCRVNVTDYSEMDLSTVMSRFCRQQQQPSEPDWMRDLEDSLPDF